MGFSPVPTVAETNRNKVNKRSPSTAAPANHNSRNYNNENVDEFGDSLAETTPLTNASRAKVNTSDVKVINSLIEDLSRQGCHVFI